MRKNGRRKRKMVGVDDQTGEGLRQVFVDTMLDGMTSLHLSSRQLAERAGLHEASISLFISGRRVPNLESMARIATALRMTVAEMLAGEPRG